MYYSPIFPFTGTDMITFDMTYYQDRNRLKESKIGFNVELRTNKGCTPEVPWKTIRARNSISAFLQMIRCSKLILDSSNGSLCNGIKVGMNIEDAIKIDPTLEYNDLDEYYESSNGYWLFTDSSSDTISNITVFIKAVLDDDEFYLYNW